MFYILQQASRARPRRPAPGPVESIEDKNAPFAPRGTAQVVEQQLLRAAEPLSVKQRAPPRSTCRLDHRGCAVYCSPCWFAAALALLSQPEPAASRFR
jgi:hypothetical protein